MRIFICLFLIILTSFAPLEEMAKTKDIYKPSLFNFKQKRDYNVLLDSLVDMIMYTDERPDFLNLLGKIESGGKHSGKNPESTAKGKYQFTDTTVENTKNRGENLGFNKKYLRNVPDNPQEWSDDQADIMALIKLFAAEVLEGDETYYGLKGREGLIDSLLTEAITNNDVTSMKDLYYTEWLTGEPTARDKRNVERHMIPYEAGQKANTLLEKLKEAFRFITE
jgi:hypothetical protein